jgi:hypothetical protein
VVVDKIYKGCNLELAGKSFKVNPMPLLMMHCSAIIEVDIFVPPENLSYNLNLVLSTCQTMVVDNTYRDYTLELASRPFRSISYYTT